MSSASTSPTRAKYPIISIEDGMAEGDWDGWANLTKLLGKTTQLVGDDLFVTNTKILKEGIDRKIANSILIKVNQIGTLTETLAAIKMAADAGYSSIVVASLGRNGKIRRSPTSPSRPARARSRRDRCAFGSHCPSTTSCCALKVSSAAR